MAWKYFSCILYYNLFCGLGKAELFMILLPNSAFSTFLKNERGM
jgi:hypothetical protein